MGTHLFASMFTKDFSSTNAFETLANDSLHNLFVYISANFHDHYDKTDRYCSLFLNLLSHIGIEYKTVSVIDDRICIEKSRKLIYNADVVWLAGGHPPTQMKHIIESGLYDCLINYDGVVVGICGGAINMGTTAICPIDIGRGKPELYAGLNYCDISIIPHFNPLNVSEDVLSISHYHPIYGVPDNSLIDRLDKEFPM